MSAVRRNILQLVKTIQDLMVILQVFRQRESGAEGLLAEIAPVILPPPGVFGQMLLQEDKVAEEDAAEVALLPLAHRGVEGGDGVPLGQVRVEGAEVSEGLLAHQALVGDLGVVQALHVVLHDVPDEDLGRHLELVEADLDLGELGGLLLFLGRPQSLDGLRQLGLLPSLGLLLGRLGFVARLVLEQHAHDDEGLVALGALMGHSEFD